MFYTHCVNRTQSFRCTQLEDLLLCIQTSRNLYLSYIHHVTYTYNIYTYTYNYLSYESWRVPSQGRGLHLFKPGVLVYYTRYLQLLYLFFLCVCVRIDCVENQYTFGRDRRNDYCFNDPIVLKSLRYRTYSKRHFRIFRVSNEGGVASVSQYKGDMASASKLQGSWVLPISVSPSEGGMTSLSQFQ